MPILVSMKSFARIAVMTFAAIAMAATSARAYDIGVSVGLLDIEDGQRFDPSAVFDELGQPDLFFCVQQGASAWTCRPDKIEDRRSTVIAARLPCRNSLSCVFKDLPVVEDEPFAFEVRDADVTENEIIDSGSCVISGDRLACDIAGGNATLSLVGGASDFRSGSTADRRIDAAMKLLSTIERDYRSAVSEQTFAFCRDPEGAVQAYLDAASGVASLQELSRHPDHGWRIAHRISEALTQQVGTTQAEAAMRRLLADFEEYPEDVDRVVRDIERFSAGSQLAPAPTARQIFRDGCL